LSEVISTVALAVRDDHGQIAADYLRLAQGHRA